MKRASLLLVLICGLLVLVSGCAQTQQSNQESELKAKLYAEAMRSVFLTSGARKEFIAVKIETLEGLSDKQKQRVMQQMKTLAKNIYSYDEIKNDPSKFYFQNGDRTGAKGGTVLSVKLLKFENNQAELEATAWYGNLGMYLITYTAKYENGRWLLKAKTIAIA